MYETNLLICIVFILFCAYIRNIVRDFLKHKSQFWNIKGPKSLPITLIAYLFTARSDAGWSHEHVHSPKSSNQTKSFTSSRSLSNIAKSIKEIPKILFPLVRHKISFCHWWSEHRTKTSHISGVCGEKFLYGTFWLSQRINCVERWKKIDLKIEEFFFWRKVIDLS